MQTVTCTNPFTALPHAMLSNSDSARQSRTVDSIATDGKAELPGHPRTGEDLSIFIRGAQNSWDHLQCHYANIAAFPLVSKAPQSINKL